MASTETIKGIAMATIPSGSFMMGHVYQFDAAQPEHVNRFYPDEQPVHKEMVKSFQLAVTTITQSYFEQNAGRENNRSAVKSPELPITNIGPHEIMLFCNKLSKEAGLASCYSEERRGRPDYLKADLSKNGFRLPTEAEWEYACRAGSTTHFYNGNTERDLDKAGWHLGNSGGTIHPVGLKEPNKFGLFDMHGNVFEFCDDDWNPNMCYGRYLTERDTDLVFDYYHTMNITRGGSWFNEASVCRSAARSCFCNWPAMNGWYNGFRVARSV